MQTKLGFCAIAAVAGLLACGAPAMATATAQITAPINEQQLVVLRGNTRPEARIARNDRGAVPEGQTMGGLELLLRRSPANEQAIEKTIAGLNDPKSPTFHHWLTNAEIGERFGVNDKDISKIGNWMNAHGLKVTGVTPDHNVIVFGGSAGAVSAAFHTSIHNLSVNGVNHFANMSDPQIPAALAPAVVGVVALHDFQPHSDAIKKRKPIKPLKMGKNGTSSNGQLFYLMPGDLATIYNLNPLFNAGITGRGQTIVVLEDTNVFKTGDWTLFRAISGLSGYKDATLTQVHPTGTASCANPGTTGDEGEAAIDVQWASASAPDANIVLASCTNAGAFGGLKALQNILAEAGHPNIISLSYGECEAANGAAANATFNQTYQNAVLEGVTVFVSSGDENAASCDGGEEAVFGINVSGFTSSPYDMSVGGTDFGTLYSQCEGSTPFPACFSSYWNTTNSHTFSSAKSYMAEVPWNDTCAGVEIAKYITGSSITYGSGGFCNSSTAAADKLVTAVGGSGGPSNCATGNAVGNSGSDGTCQGWPKPGYQTVLGNPSDGVRDIPDLSLFASNGFLQTYYVICDSEDNGSEGTPTGCSTANPQNWAGYGGTSVSTPIMAGVQALINQKTGQSWGLANTMYYQLARAEYGASGKANCNSSLGNGISKSCVFNDVTSGDMDSACGPNGPFLFNCYLPSGAVGVLSTSNSQYQKAYGTQTGWDFSTGIGTINATNLVNAWAAAASAASSTPKN